MTRDQTGVDRSALPLSNEDRLQSIIDAALDAFVSIDQHGIILEWNPQAEQTFGWSRHEAIGRLLADLIVPPSFRDGHTQGLQRFLDSGEGPVLNQRLELSALRRDGTEFPIELTILSPIEMDGQFVFNAFLRDITDRKEAEHAIRQSEALYHSLVDNLPIHVTRKDLEGKITYVNPAFCQLLGLPEQEILGKTDYDFFPAELAEKYRQDDRKVAETGDTFQCIETNQVGSETRHVEVRKTPVRDVSGEITGTQVIFWDVTQREQALKALERSNRDLDDFVANVSHDLHAPIRAVAAYCDLLQCEYQDQLDETADEYIENATAGVRRMQRLINDLRSYARVTRKDEGYKSIASEKALVDALANLEPEIQECNARITYDPLPVIKSDATQLMQLFQNLIGNAIKYRAERTPEIHVSCQESSEQWEFSVRDNGIGIKSSQSKGIFRLFHRLHSDDSDYSGTGIGLATCKRIVERFGGRIWVESKPFVGSVFHFSIAKANRGLRALPNR